jgi:5-methylcytosine-specific restriction endonuclease McrA
MSCQHKLRGQIIYKIYHGGYYCYLCGELIVKPEDLSLDHIHPRSLGGRASKDNLLGAHKWCNCEKDNLTLEEYLALKWGIILPPFKEDRIRI